MASRQKGSEWIDSAAFIIDAVLLGSIETTFQVQLPMDGHGCCCSVRLSTEQCVQQARRNVSRDDRGTKRDDPFV